MAINVHQFEEQAEAFREEMLREYYQTLAGLKEQLEIAPIYERYADLFAEDTVRALLGRRQDKQERYLAELATMGHLEQRVKDLTEAITNFILKATVEWDGEEIPYQAVQPRISNEPVMERRHELYARQRAVTAKSNDQRAERFQDMYGAAQDLGFTDYTAMCDQLEDLDLAWLTEQMRAFLDRTEEVYTEQLAHYLATIGVSRDEAEVSDTLYLFRAPHFDELFPAKRMIPALRATLAGLGIDMDSQEGLELDTEPRPLKSPRAFCAPIRVPDEVKLVIKPIGGQNDYKALFHEAGHAQHAVNTAAELPFAFKRLGDNSVTEGYAFLFDNLIRNRHWLQEVLGAPEYEDYVKFSHFYKLWYLRRYGAKLLYEQELHGGVEDPASRYTDILGNALRVGIAPEKYLEDVDDAYYAAQYLRAWIFEVQMRYYLETEYGPAWFTKPAAGRFLVDLWQQGQRDNVVELARQMGYEGLDLEPLTEELLNF
ncbi:MAG: hypothetical protein E3J21_24675 [Anaerolineales bacterium]|nr:MAG: hypothetical protein E3J21_24675 [Anaerolineales bacterium]